MTQQKDLKRLVRARMRKTGEAYTTARAQLLAKPLLGSRAATRAPVSVPVSSEAKAPAPNEYAALAGMADSAIKAKTGCTWERWVKALDKAGAATMPHQKIAELVHSKYKVGDWWTQTVTVGYERIKGLRARGQRRNGTYETTRSRTYNVPVADLFDAWADSATRKRWLTGAQSQVRKATAPKSIRLDWSANGDAKAIIAVGFTAKGAEKSAVALAHAGLPDRETADRLKQYWSEQLDSLGRVLDK